MKKSIVKTLLIIAAVSALSMGATVGCSTQPKDAQEDLSIVNKLQGDWFQVDFKYMFRDKKMSFEDNGQAFTFLSNVTGHDGTKWARYLDDFLPNSQSSERFFKYVNGNLVHFANHEMVFDPSNPSGMNPIVLTRTSTPTP